MKPLLAQILNSRWFSISVHIGLWLLVYLSATSLGGKTAEVRETDSFSTPAQSVAPVAKLDHLFSPGIWPKAIVETNSLNPFFTRHFIPPQTPTPPAPTTRKIELTYQGFYQSGDSLKQAIIKLGDSFMVTPVGAKVVTNWFVAEATLQSLTLTNLTAQTNVLTLNAKKEIEVPIQ